MIYQKDFQLVADRLTSYNEKTQFEVIKFERVAEDEKIYLTLKALGEEKSLHYVINRLYDFTDKTHYDTLSASIDEDDYMDLVIHRVDNYEEETEAEE